MTKSAGADVVPGTVVAATDGPILEIGAADGALTVPWPGWAAT